MYKFCWKWSSQVIRLTPNWLQVSKQKSESPPICFGQIFPRIVASWARCAIFPDDRGFESLISCLGLRSFFKCTGFRLAWESVHRWLYREDRKLAIPRNGTVYCVVCTCILGYFCALRKDIASGRSGTSLASAALSRTEDHDSSTFPRALHPGTYLSLLVHAPMARQRRTTWFYECFALSNRERRESKRTTT